jgi:hypothetical protein
MLVATNSAATFGGSGAPLSYRFEIYNPSGTRIHASGLVPEGSGGTTAYVVPLSVELEPEQVHEWQARAEAEGEAGPWSPRASFLSAPAVGHLRGNELYDPLINGKTVGEISGPVTFIPGVGVRLETQLSYIRYRLPQTLLEGEFSYLVTDLRTNTEGGKTKMMAMSEGLSDITTNDRRMTVEKRGDPAGLIAWRFLTHGTGVETGRSQRVEREFNPDKTYFWRASWFNRRFNVQIREGGANGREIYNMGESWTGGEYDPDPHYVFIGGPAGRAGRNSGSVDGIVIRQVWVSGRPRPSFANR